MELKRYSKVKCNGFNFKFIFWIMIVMPCLNLFPLQELQAQSEAVRVEPPSWWVGMKNNNLQLLVHGNQIGSKKPVIQYPGVVIKRIFKADSPNYLFVDLAIDKNTKPGKFKIQLGQGESVEYTLEARQPGSAMRKGFNSSDVMYLITPDRFANGEPSNDATDLTIELPKRTDKDGRHGGDIKGIINHLDYISDMGFTAIWNTPLLENNQNRTSYHGYAITDFYKVDPRFGTNENYKQLSQQAKAKGIKLILDVVLNHCGDQHWWMKDLPFKDWINFEGKYVNTSHRREANQDPYASNYDKEMMTAGWFVPTMPDLNPRNSFLGTYMIQNTIWWIEYAELGGLRIDTYPYVDKTYSTAWSKAIMNEYPNFNMVGEEWTMNPLTISYWQRGKKNADGYVSHLPSLMDFPLNQALVVGLNGDDKVFGEGMTKLYMTLANDYVYADPSNLVIFPDNHDMNRFYTQIKENFELWKLGMVFLATTRGIPEIFYGTEVLLTNPKSDADGERRVDFPGGWTGDTKNAFTGEGLTEKEKQAQSFLKSVLNLRKKTPAFHTGKLIQFVPDQSVYVYFRILGADQYMVILNKNKNAYPLPLAKFKEILGTQKTGMNLLTNQTESLQQEINIEGYGYKILQIKN